MLELILAAAAVISAFQVVQSKRLLNATIWLAFTSALVALMLYMLDAPEVAVIELSVGAGLVTVLFVFAFSIVGEELLAELTLVPRPLIWGLVLVTAFLLGWYALPVKPIGQEEPQFQFAYVLWQQRGLDVLAQVVFIFSGVMGLLGLLTEQGAVHESAPQRLAEHALPTPQPKDIIEVTPQQEVHA